MPDAVHTSSPPASGAPPTAPVSAEKVALRLDIAGSLRKHKVLALLTFFAVLAVGLPLANIKGKPAYVASAVIFVSPRFVANLQDDKEFDLQSNTEYREYVQQNVRTINRFDIMLEAIERLGDGKGVWVRPNEPLTRAAERLQHALKVEPIPDTYQILVSLEGDRPTGLDTVVNSVADTFIAKTRTEEFYGSDERIKNLREERARLLEENSKRQDERARLASDLGVSTFSESIQNPYDKLLVEAKTALASAGRDRIQAEADLASLHGSSSTSGMSALDAYALEMVNKDPGLTTLDANLNTRRSALLSEISGLKADHPGRKAAEKELDELQQERDRAQARLMRSYSAMLEEQKQAQVDKTTRLEQSLQQELVKQAAQAASFSSGYQHAITLGQDVDLAVKRIGSIEDRINFLSLESRAPGFVRLFSSARPPDAPFKGGRRRLYMIAGLVALLAALAVPVCVDYLDPRIHWPGDVQKVLGFAPLGWILEKKQAGDGFEKEQVLRLASRIAQEAQTRSTRIFAFTGVSARNGTTTIVRELALSLTHLGMPALAVEANAYRADPRYRDPKSRGLTVVLRGASDIAAEIVPGTDDYADYIPVGDVGNFENLPDLQNLVKILREATNVYPVVLVDLPPILASVDAELVARAADVVVLVIQAEAVTKAELKSAAKALERIQPTAVAAILNRVQLETAAGFGREARDEFYKGTSRPTTVWASPWLWK